MAESAIISGNLVNASNAYGGGVHIGDNGRFIMQGGGKVGSTEKVVSDDIGNTSETIVALAP